MNWQEVCESQSLHNLPFKIELNATGKILMSPVKVYHSVLQGEIAALLRLHRNDGKILNECAIHTKSGTKVADVAWVSKERYQIIKAEIECSIAPELCVEVISSSNNNSEIEAKKALYFDNGAQEVWLCNKKGHIEFFNLEQRIEKSELFPLFPNYINIDA
jgi:Uma2 family endonuclease